MSIALSTLVILGASITGLAVARDAHRHGLRPVVVDSEEGPGLHSRRATPVNVGCAIQAATIDRIASLGGPQVALISTSDDWIRFVIEYRPVLSSSYGLIKIFLSLSLDRLAWSAMDALGSDLVGSYYPQTDTSPTVIFEPGRATTSSSQCLVLRVLAVKEGSSGVHSVILDGGKNIAMPTGYEWHELLAVTGAADARDSRYNFYRPLCHPGDLHFQSKAFRTLEAGDLVAIMDAGAYFIPNQMNFSNPRPAVVMVRYGQTSPLRQRESFQDIVRLDERGDSREYGSQVAQFGMRDRG